MKVIITLPKSLILGLAKREQKIINDSPKDGFGQTDIEEWWKHVGKRDAFYEIIDLYESISADDEDAYEELQAVYEEFDG